jgi:SAM-dependent methyltransferase
MSDPIPYYDALADSYDADRFGNTYGRFVDAREQALLRDWLSDVPADAVVELGCGTGRMLAFARVGVDGSAPMLEQARRRHPDRTLVHGPVTATGLPDASFDAAVCFHVLMHLDEASVRAVFAEVARLVRTGGRFLFDIPSGERRSWGRRAPHGWHADTAATLDSLRDWAGPSWVLRRSHGLLTIPVHRVPRALRARLIPADRWLGASPGRRWASYHAVWMERR